MYTDSSKYSLKAGQYVSKKTGELVKTWEIGGLTSWKTVSVQQGEEIEVCKLLEKALSDMKRIAGKRVEIDAAQINLSKALKSREAFTVIFQKYPDKLREEMANEDHAVESAKAELAKITGQTS